jgi:hypothetical protein
MADLLMTRACDVPLADNGPIRPVDPLPLCGEWLNYDIHATGIHRMEIDEWEGTPVVRAFGACPTGPIDWGEVPGAAFAGGVDDHEAVAFTACFDLRFAHLLLAGYLNKRLLVVDAYTTFADGSGRANYFQRDHFYCP